MSQNYLDMSRIDRLRSQAINDRYADAYNSAQQTIFRFLNRKFTLNPNGEWVKRFGVEFKHNTGRAIIYVYQHESRTGRSFSFISNWCNQHLTVNLIETWGQSTDTSYKDSCGRTVVHTRVWDKPIYIDNLLAIKLAQVKYVSLLVKYNAEFHLQLQE